MSNSDVVMAFVNAINALDWDAIEALFADDIFYHNIPMAPVEGKAAALEVLRGMQPKEMDWEVLNIAENGDFVLTERVDNFVMADGHKWMLGPEGLALFYCRDSVRERLTLHEYGWHMVHEPFDFDQRDWRPASTAIRTTCPG